MRKSIAWILAASILVVAGMVALKEQMEPIIVSAGETAYVAVYGWLVDRDIVPPVR